MVILQKFINMLKNKLLEIMDRLKYYIEYRYALSVRTVGLKKFFIFFTIKLIILFFVFWYIKLALIDTKILGDFISAILSLIKPEEVVSVIPEIKTEPEKIIIEEKLVELKKDENNLVKKLIIYSAIGLTIIIGVGVVLIVANTGVESTIETIKVAINTVVGGSPEIVDLGAGAVTAGALISLGDLEAASAAIGVVMPVGDLGSASGAILSIKDLKSAAAAAGARDALIEDFVKHFGDFSDYESEEEEDSESEVNNSNNFIAEGNNFTNIGTEVNNVRTEVNNFINFRTGGNNFTNFRTGGDFGYFHGKVSLEDLLKPGFNFGDLEVESSEEDLD